MKKILNFEEFILRYVLSKGKGRKTSHRIYNQATSAILSAYDTNAFKHRRNRMMLIMLYDTGARVQELADLNLSSLHLDVPNPFVTLIGKGRKSRNVPLLNKTVYFI